MQVSLLLPFVLLVFLLALQWAMHAWATTTAHAAAQDAARVAAAHGSSESAGRSTGSDAADNGSLTDVRVTVARGPVETTAVVEGRALVVVPLFPTPVRAEAAAPTERLTRR